MGEAIIEEHYEEMVRLQGLGFGAAQARDALRQANGNFDAAVEVLVGA